MTEGNVDEINKIKQRFAIFYLVSLVLLVFIFLLLSGRGLKLFRFGNTAQQVQPELIRNNQMLVQDGLLHSRLNNLQQMDGNFAMTLTDSSKKGQVDSINRTILVMEANFLKTLDSIEYENKRNTGNSQEVMRDITEAFREELSNRRVLTNLRMALSSGNKMFTGDQTMVLQWQNEMLAKQKRIESLENDLKAWQLNLYNNNHSSVNELLKQDNTILQSAYKEQDKKIATLTTANMALKLENDKLRTQPSDTRKVTDAGDNTNKEKYAAMERQISELNAEIRLSQVDCNLSRADAQQIISNSKQRKVLLSDALNLLNGLSKTEDPVLLLKVREKIARLKQLANTVRD